MSLTLDGNDCLLSIRSDLAGSPYVPVEGARIIAWKVSQDVVEVTDAGDGPWRRLLSGSGLRSLQVEVQGLYLGSAGEVLLSQLALSGVAFDAEMTLGAGKAVRGSFITSALSIESAVNEEATYAATLRSAGPVELN